MATYSSILALRIPGTEEPGRLQFMGLQKVSTTEQLTLILSAIKRIPIIGSFIHLTNNY